MLAIATAWQQQGTAFSGLAFAHQQGFSIGRCIEDLQLIAECCPPDELANRILFIPLQ